ncbi:AAA family ATPase [Paenibacillus apiarius]|uniref:AAA family ATPase n=1 Tax=Paenibacillus apiarius TaxID=46240 RepID=A0ABT4DTW0_9BACL|nr:AAA family ATPase [Paenibacillus apiarius]MCY9515887.1 AAA family ATPase [Paenibacillus apiarius]MCY9520797.1 AAA family ATPase [Paenibacillus apiarius]MCY9553501.1 AAA family ATPase [Paenibacillus apiarius]MCY9557975.1 AAA family ATPase [Paenibacillus apiarius]MCY9685830.1 AAA family ATPase [Paenibacillus apiarius]
MSDDNRLITTQARKINVVFKNFPPEPIRTVEDMPSKETNQHTEAFAEIFKELDEMIGLEEVKELVFQIYAMLQIKQLRKNEGLQVNSQVYHMLFKGNPGTGKTTVARIMAKMFQKLGMLSKGHLMEVERADLVGEYIGHTAQKTREVVKKALGGILFVDEAYSLARGGEKDFGKECIDCLVKAMEDHKNDFILILAGYPKEINNLLKTNSGLPSRFPIHVEFPDYTTDQLVKIAYKMAFEREYIILTEATNKIKEHLAQEKHINHNFSNARFVRNLIEKAIRNQAVRLIRKSKKLTKEDLTNLTYEDFLISEKNEPAGVEKIYNI